MAETTTTRPARTRASKPATAKAAPAKAAPKAEAVTPDEEKRERYTYTMDVHPEGPTKPKKGTGYARFTPPEGSGCVGTLYTPVGVEIVRVLMIGPAEVLPE